jgi:hypothetical protein
MHKNTTMLLHPFQNVRDLYFKTDEIEKKIHTVIFCWLKFYLKRGKLAPGGDLLLYIDQGERSRELVRDNASVGAVRPSRR